MASPLRVLFVGVKWPPETFLSRLILGLVRRGVGVTLALSDQPDAAWRALPNVEIMVTGAWQGPAGSRLWRAGRRLAGAAWRSPAETKRLYAAARADRSGGRTTHQLHRWLPFAGREWDVIYFPWNATAIDYLPLLDKSPSVVSCRGTQIYVAPHNPRRRALRDGLRESFGKAAAVHCVSEAIRVEAERYGLDRGKAVVIHPAVDPDVFRPAVDDARPPAAPFRIVSTGSILWRKGYEYALSAIRLLVDQGAPVRYDIIGGGDETNRLLYTIHDLDLAEHVHWHGHLEPGEVVARLQKADAFLLSSLCEGISNAALEGMACGLPVVTTAVGGMPEAVADGVEGFLTPVGDAPAMAAGLRELWQRPDLRRQMGAAGRARVLHDFRLDDQVEAFVGLFRSVA
jgi:colanic acid/amylovoran biosynthesis glycosyltransferase